MKTFSYRGYTDRGSVCKGLIEAFHEKDAGERLAARRIFPTSLQEAGHEQRMLTFLKKKKTITRDARALLYRELAVLLRAGLPLAQALELLIDTPELSAWHTVLAAVRDGIRQGDSLALAQDKAGFTDDSLERALIEMGEQAGALGDVLFRLAEYLEEQTKLRDRIQTALIYPSLVLTMSILIMLFMVGFMMPRFSQLFAEARLTLPLFTRAVMLGGQMAGYLIILLLALASGAAVLWQHIYRKRASAVIRLERFFFSAPVIGKGWTAVVNMRFAQTLALLLRSGITLIKALHYAGRATNSQWTISEIDRETEQVRQGSTLAQAVRRIPTLSGSLPGWIQAGEAGGNLSLMLDEAAHRYQQQWDRMMARFLAVLEPVLILTIGFSVLIIALAVLMPVMSLNDALGQ